MTDMDTLRQAHTLAVLAHRLWSILFVMCGLLDITTRSVIHLIFVAASLVIVATASLLATHTKRLITENGGRCE